MSETDDSIFMTEDDYCEDREERLRAEITKLTSQLEEARAKAINACIKIADNHAVMADSCIEKGAAEMIAVDLRALLPGSTK